LTEEFEDIELGYSSAEHENFGFWRQVYAGKGELKDTEERALDLLPQAEPLNAREIA